jgi:hypothetical protein
MDSWSGGKTPPCASERSPEMNFSLHSGGTPIDTLNLEYHAGEKQIDNLIK